MTQMKQFPTIIYYVNLSPIMKWKSFDTLIHTKVSNSNFTLAVDSPKLGQAKSDIIYVCSLTYIVIRQKVSLGLSEFW